MQGQTVSGNPAAKTDELINGRFAFFYMKIPGQPKTKIAFNFNISRETLYQYVWADGFQ